MAILLIWDYIVNRVRKNRLSKEEKLMTAVRTKGVEIKKEIKKDARSFSIKEFTRHEPICRVSRIGKSLYIRNNKKVAPVTGESVKVLREKIKESHAPAKLTFHGLSRAQVGRVVGDIVHNNDHVNVHVRKSSSEDSPVLEFEVLIVDGKYHVEHKEQEKE